MNSSRFRRIPVLLALTALFGVLACGRAPGEEDLEYLRGYWEIERVVFPQGEVKAYSGNTVVDYYQLNGREGYLKKLQPDADGRYLATDDALSLEVVVREDGLILRFEGKAQPWEEEILELSPERLVTRHGNGLRYEYKRHVPLQIPQS